MCFLWLKRIVSVCGGKIASLGVGLAEEPGGMSLIGTSASPGIGARPPLSEASSGTAAGAAVGAAEGATDGAAEADGAGAAGCADASGWRRPTPSAATHAAIVSQPGSGRERRGRLIF